MVTLGPGDVRHKNIKHRETLEKNTSVASIQILYPLFVISNQILHMKWNINHFKIYPIIALKKKHAQ